MQMGWARFVRAQPIAESSITPPLAVGDARVNLFSLVSADYRLSGYAVAGPDNDRDTIRTAALPETGTNPPGSAGERSTTPPERLRAQVFW